MGTTMAKIKVLDSNITILQDDYISLTDMLKNTELVGNFMSNDNKTQFPRYNYIIMYG